jgi:predicted nucleic acid-binding protein
MIVYLDTSALAKRYLSEEASTEVERFVAGAERVGTSIVARVEVVSAIARARRQKLLNEQPAASLRALFEDQWPFIVRLSLNESTVARACSLVWELGLRGYGAVHLASALAWREAIAESPVFATFDKALGKAARAQGLDVWPEGLE